VFLGETEEYEPLSRAAFYKAMLKEKISKMEVKAEEVVRELNDTSAQKRIKKVD
jgi:thymidine kinase